MLRFFLQVARKFTDYNIREYTKRIVVDAFRHNRNLSDPSSISVMFSNGKAQLEVAKQPSSRASLRLIHSGLQAAGLVVQM
ncbi:hypothetical protein ACFX2C_046745 [Malus domestica]